MSRKTNKPVFKPYIMNQGQLLPQSYDEVIEPGHLVRVVNETIEKLDLSSLEAKYKGRGTSSYHPRILLKVLVYAYCKKIYTSRKIVAAMRENIHFMWLSGGNQPDFCTINDFRGMRMKEDRGEEKPWPKPAYNVQNGTEGQSIMGYSVHGQAEDTTRLIPHLDQVRENLNGRLPKKIVADAA